MRRDVSVTEWIMHSSERTSGLVSASESERTPFFDPRPKWGVDEIRLCDNRMRRVGRSEEEQGNQRHHTQSGDAQMQTWTGVMKSGRCWREAGKERHLATCQYQATHRQRSPCMAYLRGDPISEVGGVGLLPALCRRRTAWRRNVLRSRRKTTVSSLPGAVQGERWLASESVSLIFLWQLSVVLLEDPARSDSRKYSKKNYVL